MQNMYTHIHTYLSICTHTHVYVLHIIHIHAGFLDVVDRYDSQDDTLAAVLGHEMSHALLGHAAEKISWQACVHELICVHMDAYVCI